MQNKNLPIFEIKDDLYSIIFKRKSIRNYDATPLDNGILEEISKILA